MGGLDNVSMQDSLFPDSICFGCGPSNEDGLQLKSFRQADGSVIAEITPELKHQAGPGVLCGGIVGTLLDCHAAMAAVVALDISTTDEGMVTKEFTVRLKNVTPIAPLTIHARSVDHDQRRATIHARIEHDGTVTAEFEGVFVAPGRPR